jgi:hypothetical protein
LAEILKAGTAKNMYMYASSVIVVFVLGMSMGSTVKPIDVVITDSNIEISILVRATGPTSSRDAAVALVVARPVPRFPIFAMMVGQSMIAAYSPRISGPNNLAKMILCANVKALSNMFAA